jgi:tetratricopeptide (TPR) repeat protein
LLQLGNFAEVHERAAYSLKSSRVFGSDLLSYALDHLSLGRAALELSDYVKARAQFDQAVESLRQAGEIDRVPLGLLARAALFRKTGDFLAARRDLEEAMRIATRSEMRLSQSDARLEYAWLALAEGADDAKQKAREHVAEARRLVEETGYGRRRPEVEALEAKLGSGPG